MGLAGEIAAMWRSFLTTVHRQLRWRDVGENTNIAAWAVGAVLAVLTAPSGVKLFFTSRSCTEVAATQFGCLIVSADSLELP